TASRTSARSSGSLASKRTQAWPLVTMAASGWLISWAMEVVSSPIVVRRATRARSAWAVRTASSACWRWRVSASRAALERAVFERNRRLPREQSQRQRALGRKGARGKGILQVEEANQGGLLHQRQAEHGPRPPLLHVRIRRKGVRALGIVEEHGLPRPEHGVE